MRGTGAEYQVPFDEQPTPPAGWQVRLTDPSDFRLIAKLVPSGLVVVTV